MCDTPGWEHTIIEYDNKIPDRDFKIVDVANLKISKHPLSEQNEKDSGSRFLELCGSIKVHGLICLIIVREVNDYYEVIDGTRRLHAFRAMGIQRTPVYIIKNMDARFVVLIQFRFDQPPFIKFAQNQCSKCSVHYCCEYGSHNSWITTRITMGSQLIPSAHRAPQVYILYPKNSDCH
jgi:hypothetical protein